MTSWIPSRSASTDAGGSAASVIIDRGRITATGTMEELRAQAGSELASLEDLFLKLTAGPESKELIDRLLA